MPSLEKIDLRGGYRIRDQQAMHYLTFTVQQWADIFTRWPTQMKMGQKSPKIGTK